MWAILGPPVFAAKSADFAALVQSAIQVEEEENCQVECLSDTILAPPDTETRGSSNEAVPGETSTRQKRQHKKRRLTRNQSILSHGYPSAAGKYLKTAQVIKSKLNTADLPVERGAHRAMKAPAAPYNPREIPEIKQLMAKGFQYISCNDTNGVPSRLPQPIVDRDGRIIAVIGGSPPEDSDTYDTDARDLFKIIIEESNSTTFTKKELEHQRGNFPAINFGYTLPHGYNEPINLNNCHHKEKISRICSSKGFQRISAFQNGASRLVIHDIYRKKRSEAGLTHSGFILAVFAFWNPGVYAYQKSRIEQLLARHPELKRTSEKTIFPTMACNFRNVRCLPHRDTQNCPFGWCCITALGDFDHTQGGHIVLEELKLIIEFPHAYTVAIPSATITHSNIPVVDGDVRVSITQYCAGNIFRYVDNGFRTDKALRREDKKRAEEAEAFKADRWKMSLGLLRTLKDLENGQLPYVSGFQ